MAEFDFYGTWDDSRTYLEGLAKRQQFTFVINQAYVEPIPIQFTTVSDETWRIVQQHPLLLLWSDSYSQFPPTFDKASKGFARISVLTSGPAIEMSLPRPLDQDGQIRIYAGDIMYQSRYQNPETREWYQCPASVRSVFRHVRSMLRHNLVRRFVRVQAVRNGLIRPEAMPVWIGYDALRLLEEHAATLGPSYWTIEDLAETVNELSLRVSDDT